jgi:hypothetical protein
MDRSRPVVERRPTLPGRGLVGHVCEEGCGWERGLERVVEVDRKRCRRRGVCRLLRFGFCPRGFWRECRWSVGVGFWKAVSNVLQQGRRWTTHTISSSSFRMSPSC